jgi:hypothetical protein
VAEGQGAVPLDVLRTSDLVGHSNWSWDTALAGQVKDLTPEGRTPRYHRTTRTSRPDRNGERERLAFVLVMILVMPAHPRPRRWAGMTRIMTRTNASRSRSPLRSGRLVRVVR